jgi:prevent-host-death family protein
MRTVNMHEAKTHLSRLAEEVAAGEEVIIAKAGKPVMKLVPFRPERKRRTLGLLKGKIHITGDFDDPLPQEILGAFEGKANDDS